MQRTKTIDVVVQKSSESFVLPCSKMAIIVDTVFKENFVRETDKNSILYETEYVPFKQFAQNSFGKCPASKEILAHIFALMDRIVSTTEFVLKPQNANRLLAGLIIIVNKHQSKLTKFYDKIFNMTKEEIQEIEKEVRQYLTEIEVPSDLLKDYVEHIYKS